MNVMKTDVVIIGSGLAGLMTAYYLCEKYNVALVTKTKLANSNSSLAQGGIAAAVAKEDHWKKHFQDTVVAGGYHNEKKATELLVKKGTTLIKKLVEIGVSFDRDEKNEFSLGMEGAHRVRRVLHAGGDATGKVMVESVIANVLPKINVIEDSTAYDLHVENGGCCGVYIKDQNENLCFIEADHVILATGGIGQLYKVTSNCKEATGDGITMAYRAGAAIADMEFIQFHPTLMMVDGDCLGLISEAVRGEGAKLVTEDGNYLMQGKHQLEDLAPRDIVAREIFKMRQKSETVYLDIKNIRNFKERFPSITNMCKHTGVLEKGLISVEPGAHFIMGGIKVNENGETTVKNLYAVGECANTGVHGANRLASNSLLEAVVFADHLAKTILLARKQRSYDVKLNVKVPSSVPLNLPTIEQIQNVMDRYVGIIRNERDLKRAIKWFKQFKDIYEEQNHLHLSIHEKTICNMLIVGYLIANASLKRNESRGGHYRLDFPQTNDERWVGFKNVSVNGVLYREKFHEYNDLIEQSLPKVKKELSIS
ncbi:L-aspartate oxidase [Anaerobacillus alkalilacustris]|uniref:L-aspartate oxidase n=1 Tax=Anaerobacillus alkalilacustris TaxID=393763 RepID=A0A1S2LW78_9BACI|nr:L-aspartate oxidase [Anaerobacillus alkalilacustris]OIJ16574.1 L-aspartate oxidase [Anaerobacillus alkalilacustris]